MTKDISTTMDVDMYTSSCLRVLEVVRAGRLELQRKEEERQRSQEAEAKAQQARINSLWAPKVEAAERALPEWMHEYIRWDDTQEPASNGIWVILDLPECLPIEMWPDTDLRRDQDSMRFAVPTVTTWQDEDDEWQVYAPVNHKAWDRYPTLEIAVAYAHERYGQYLEANYKVEQRNIEAHAAAEAKKAAAAPTPAATPTVEIPMDPAAKVLATIAELNLDLDTVFERGLLYGFIALAAELRAIRTATEDLAAVVVANDPKATEEN